MTKLCPHCRHPITPEVRQDEGICPACGKQWHLRIIYQSILCQGPLVKEIDRKDSAAKAKAFVPQ